MQTPAAGVRVAVRARGGRGYFLPFLGRTRRVPARREGDRIVFALPEIGKGAAFWFEPAAG